MSFYSVNQVMLLGRLGSDPDARTTKEGLVIVRLSLATSRSRKVENEWVEETDWHRVVCFGKLAEYLAKHARSGQIATVTGSIRYNKWTDRNGIDRWSTEIMADKVILAESPRKPAYARDDADTDAPAGTYAEPSDDDIPF